MTQFRSKDAVRSGLPLGGIGAGKMELLPNGLFSAFTFQNNWSKPAGGEGKYPGVLGYHMAVRVARPGKAPVMRLLQTVPVQGLPLVRGIRYEGIFPRITMRFEDPALGLDLTLKAFTPWIPGDVKHSSLPAVFFEVEARNKGRESAELGFLFIGRNLSGKWCVGRRNRVVEDARAVQLEFLNEDPSERDVRQGELRFRFEKAGWSAGFIESWNAVRQNFSFDADSIALEAWERFAQDGTLPRARGGQTVQGENRELCGAVSLSGVLRPGRTKKIRFLSAWHFPKHPLGHRYASWFKSAGQVSAYAASRRARLQQAQRRVEKAVFALPFPSWFNEALLANLAPFVASSWYVADGRFAFYEAPVVCPLMGTLDVGFYGSIPLSYFFPELEKSQIEQFAKAQRADGYIPHDLGKNRLDMPSNGTTFFFWKDLNPKFILMLYRDCLWSGDRDLLRRLYPHAKKAFVWSCRTDTDGNGLPDNEGADQTFDLWGFFGTTAYTSSIFLAAALAMERMALLRGDAGFARLCRTTFEKGTRSFERELWNGRFFGQNCALSQLNGQWYADLLGLGPIADPVKIRTAAATVLRMNSPLSRFGMVNSVLPDGSPDLSNDHSRNIWSGMNYAFASLCVSQGFPLPPVLRQVRKLWDNVTKVQKNPWNQPDTIDSETGRYVFGDSYYRNMAIWSIPIAYAMRDRRAASRLAALRALGRPRTPR